jgi:hypothetical protein
VHFYHVQASDIRATSVMLTSPRAFDVCFIYNGALTSLENQEENKSIGGSIERWEAND